MGRNEEYLRKVYKEQNEGNTKFILWENFLQACAADRESESKEFSNSNRQPNDDYK